jgi:hypothetical protein
MIFYSFSCQGMIHDWLHQRLPIFPEAFDVHEYCPYPQKSCLEMSHPFSVETRKPIEYINSFKEVIYFTYDQKLDRCFMFVADMAVARGIQDFVENHVRHCLPHLVL